MSPVDPVDLILIAYYVASSARVGNYDIANSAVCHGMLFSSTASHVL